MQRKYLPGTSLADDELESIVCCYLGSMWVLCKQDRTVHRHIALPGSQLQIICMQARKFMAQSLRYVAHLNGASLVYIGGLKASTAGIQSSSRTDTAADKAVLDNFRSMLSHMMFTGMDKRM